MKGKKNKQKKVKEEKSEKSLCLVVCEFVISQQSSKLPHCTTTLHIPKTASISCKKILPLKLLAKSKYTFKLPRNS